MIRVLFIGRSTPDWVDRLDDVVSSHVVELDHAVLPAAGIRRIDETPPDLVVVVGPESDARLGNLLEGIRSRPAGALAPVVLLADAEPPADVLAHCDALLGLAVSERDLIGTFAALLDVPLDGFGPVAPRTSPTRTPSEPGRVVPVEVTLDEERPATTRATPDLVGENDINRTWRAARTASYFEVLEVEPSADTDEIRAALAYQRARFAPRNVPEALASARANDLREIRETLDDAGAVLADPELRDHYSRHHR